MDVISKFHNLFSTLFQHSEVFSNLILKRLLNSYTDSKKDVSHLASLLTGHQPCENPVYNSTIYDFTERKIRKIDPLE